MNNQNRGRDEINEIKFLNGLTDKWLSEVTGIEYNTLNRQLTTASNFRDDVYKACMTAFKKHGYVSNTKEQCEKLITEVLEFNSVINGSASILNRSVKEKISDLSLSISEKKQLKNEIAQIKSRVIDVLDELTITIDLK